MVPPANNKFKAALIRAQEQIAAVIPEYLTPDRMIQIAVMSVYRSPLLQKCDPMSVVAAVVEAAACGLEPGGPTQHGDLLPVWNSKSSSYECQFRPRYAGMVQLARNTGELADIYAEVVYTQDEFDFEMGLNRRLTHKRTLSAEPRSDRDIIATYAVAKLVNGEVNFVVLERWEIDKIRACSESEKAKVKGKVIHTTWDDWFSEMCKKTATKRVCKLLPKSVRLIRAIESDNRDWKFDGEVDARERISEATADRAAALRNRLSAPIDAEFVEQPTSEMSGSFPIVDTPAE